MNSLTKRFKPCSHSADEILHLVLETLTAALKAAPEAAVQWEPHISGAGADRLRCRMRYAWCFWQYGITRVCRVMACTV